MTDRKKILHVVPDTKRIKMQIKYVKLIIYSQVVCIFLLVAGFNIIFRLLMTSAQLGRYAEMHMNIVYHWMNWLFASVTIISIAAGALFSLKLSHRFLGPLYRLENTLRDAIDKGTCPLLKVRKDDDLYEVVDLLNSALSKQGELS